MSAEQELLSAWHSEGEFLSAYDASRAATLARHEHSTLAELGALKSELCAGSTVANYPTMADQGRLGGMISAIDDLMEARLPG